MSSRTQKIEDIYKAACIDEIKTQLGTRYFVQSHQDVRKSGFPDIALHGEGVCTSWEFKHATPRFSSPGIQEWTCRRIAKSSYCRYVIYVENFAYEDSMIADTLTTRARSSRTLQKSMKTTWIVNPDEIAGCDGRLEEITPDSILCGFDHIAVVRYMASVHRGLSKVA